MLKNKIDTKVFDFEMFFSGKVKVESLDAGATTYGGATKLRDGHIYSNIEKDSFISLKDGRNTISIYVPSTIDINIQIDNTSYVERTLNQLMSKYPLDDLFIFNTSGSWYSDEIEEVVVEKSLC